MVIDSNDNVFALLGGKLKDLVGWQIVTDSAANLMAKLATDSHFTDQDVHHQQAHPETPYPSVSRGVSHGGGQMVTNPLHIPFLVPMSLQQPGKLCNHPNNVKITDEMMAHIFFR
ncbi:hypothetical protein MSAN_00152900 [Mycena sanguinolenta]|uniref:Uncharacterized protein n=1 Tax=Mycena sanguinolenta TaxID=230812 RepID=A0A8H7DL03_9AGAR|nr:hypothetical protein MSAN_00152900 [Mycena sanguinolenta]